MPNDADRKSVLILGGPNTGKSHYAFQLFGRLRVGGCNLELRRTPDNISLFEAGLQRLNQGLAATHTSMDTYLECTLPLRLGDRKVDVCWPDYDGEQLFRQVTQRRITQSWKDRLRSADAWMLFIRLAITQRLKDVLADPLEAEIPTAKGTPKEDGGLFHRADELSGQAKLIELLQMLLHVRRVDISRPTLAPMLGVVISCWDELGADKVMAPEDLLSKQAPLICQFLQANWDPKSRHIMGLSSTEKPLSKETPDEGYKAKGPECFGFAIDRNGMETRDLTLPISMLLDLAADEC